MTLCPGGDGSWTSCRGGGVDGGVRAKMREGGVEGVVAGVGVGWGFVIGGSGRGCSWGRGGVGV